MSKYISEVSWTNNLQTTETGRIKKTQFNVVELVRNHPNFRDLVFIYDVKYGTSYVMRGKITNAINSYCKTDDVFFNILITCEDELGFLPSDNMVWNAIEFFSMKNPIGVKMFELDDYSVQDFISNHPLYSKIEINESGVLTLDGRRMHDGDYSDIVYYYKQELKRNKESYKDAFYTDGSCHELFSNIRFAEAESYRYARNKKH